MPVCVHVYMEARGQSQVVVPHVPFTFISFETVSFIVLEFSEELARLPRKALRISTGLCLPVLGLSVSTVFMWILGI